MAITSVSIPLDILVMSDLRLADKLVYGVLHSYATQRGGVRTADKHTVISIAARTSCDIKTVRKALDVLIGRGLVARASKKDDYLVYPAPAAAAGQEKQQDTPAAAAPAAETSTRPLPPGSPEEPWWLPAKSYDDLAVLIRTNYPEGITLDELWQLACDAGNHHTGLWFTRAHTQVEEHLKSNGLPSTDRIKINVKR